MGALPLHCELHEEPALRPVLAHPVDHSVSRSMSGACSRTSRCPPNDAGRGSRYYIVTTFRNSVLGILSNQMISDAALLLVRDESTLKKVFCILVYFCIRLNLLNVVAMVKVKSLFHR